MWVDGGSLPGSPLPPAQQAPGQVPQQPPPPPLQRQGTDKPQP